MQRDKRVHTFLLALQIFPFYGLSTVSMAQENPDEKTKLNSSYHFKNIKVFKRNDLQNKFKDNSLIVNQTTKESKMPPNKNEITGINQERLLLNDD